MRTFDHESTTVLGDYFSVDGKYDGNGCGIFNSESSGDGSGDGCGFCGDVRGNGSGVGFVSQYSEHVSGYTLHGNGYGVGK